MNRKTNTTMTCASPVTATAAITKRAAKLYKKEAAKPSGL